VKPVEVVLVVLAAAFFVSVVLIYPAFASTMGVGFKAAFSLWGIMMLMATLTFCIGLLTFNPEDK
jgi:hypothetical protein